MDQNPETWTADQTPKLVQNPLSTDIVCDYREDDNTQRKLIIPALDTVTLPTYLANHAGKNVVDAIINTRKLGFVTPEERLELEKEVFI